MLINSVLIKRKCVPGMIKKNYGGIRGLSYLTLGKAKKIGKKNVFKKLPADFLRVPTTIC